MGVRTGNPVWVDSTDSADAAANPSRKITAAKLNAIEAAIDALPGGGVETVSGVVDLDGTGSPVREFYCTDAATVEGVSFSAGTAVVFRRTPAGVWGYIVVDPWTDLVATTTTTTTEATTTTTTTEATTTTTTTEATTTTTTTEAAPLGTLSEEVLALSPLGYWKLDETSGTVASDSSVNARHGTYVGEIALGGPGQFMNITGGLGGGVEIPDNDAWSLAGTTGMTIFALTYRTSNGAVPAPIVCKMDTGQYEWSYFWDTAGKLNISVYNLTASATLLTDVTTNSVPLSAWNALAVTIPTPVLGATAKHYVNSSTAQAATHTQAAATVSNGTSILRIGRRTDNTHKYFGRIGHVAIFPGELTATQVARLIDSARAGGLIP